MANILKYSAALLMLGIGLAFGIVSLWLNTSHGLEVGIIAGIICGLADVARISIPVIAAERGWSKQMTYGIVALGLFSLFNISSYLATEYGRPIWNEVQSQKAMARRVTEIERLQSKIEKITEKRSAKALRDLAQIEKDRKGCGQNCQGYLTQADEAERREKMEAEVVKLEALNKSAEAAEIEVKGFGLLFLWFGASPLVAVTIMHAIEGGLRLLVVDFMVYFLIPGAVLFRSIRKDAQLAERGIDMTPVQGKARKDGSKRLTKEEAYRKVVAHILETGSGSVLTSRRQLAAIVEAPKTTFNEWMASWIANGDLLVMTKQRGKELISLRKAA